MFQDIPIYIWELSDHNSFYGFPKQPGVDGVKVALHLQPHTDHVNSCDPDKLDRNVSPGELAHVKAILQEHMPNLAGDIVKTATCMYTTTPDEHL